MWSFILLSTCVALVCGAPLEDNEEERSIDLSHLGNRVFKKPSNDTGKILESWDPQSEVNPEELGEYAEGDILFPSLGRNGLVAQSFRWKGGVIPYEISGRYSAAEINMIRRAMNIYHKYTCVSFRERQASDNDYISIVSGSTGCWSSVGRISGRQEINLQSPYCLTKVGTPLHELMHAVGFLHEQNRFERDDYVRIAWQNIQSGHSNNFDKASKDQTSGFGVPYDFRSVMHYSKTAFSINGNPTIVPMESDKGEKMGQREGFSIGDIRKINNMYGCPEKSPGYKEPNFPSNPGNTGGNNRPVGNFLGGLLSIFTGRDEEDKVE